MITNSDHMTNFVYKVTQKLHVGRIYKDATHLQCFQILQM